MENKKFNSFALVMIVIMAVFSIYTAVGKNQAKDGRDGLSAYERAVQLGEFSGSEFEYLQSLHGKNGSNVTLEDVYEAYIKEKNYSKDDYTFSDFVLSFYPDEILDADETASMIQTSTQSALRSTVDICYSFCLNNPILYVVDYDENNYQIITNSKYYNRYASTGVSAGSGVIYKIEGTETPDKSDDVAYIITNYHVVYALNFINDESKYRVYNKLTTDYFGNVINEKIFTATYDEENVITSGNAKYINKNNVNDAPIETHFLTDYGIYLYGYQSEEYELSASFVGGSAENDIAVLKVERTKTSNNEKLFDGTYKEIDLGDSKDLDIGEQIIAVGNPLLPDISNVNDTSGAQVYVNDMKKSYIDALCLTATSGDISNISEYCKFENLINPTESVDMRLIRVSAAINSGNSGGGLYDIFGRLIGIVNGKIASQNYDNIGFAIPINIAANLADRIISECDGTNTQISVLKAELESLGITVKNGISNSYYDSNKLVWVITNNVVVNSSSILNLEVGSIIQAISFDDEETKYYLTQDYDLNDILIKAQKGITQKVVLHILQTDSTVFEFEINVDENNFILVD